LLYIDVKYAQFAGRSINLFKVVRNFPFLARGRCKICGDSQRNKSKTRFYFYEKEGKINAQCHNCGYSASLGFYLKEYEPLLNSEYVFETFKGSKEYSAPVKEQEFIPKQIKFQKSDFPHISVLPSVWELDETHPVRKYIEGRKIPKSFPVLYAENFCNFASKFKDEFKNTTKDHARIIVPFIKDNRIFAFQARTLGKETPKYYTIFIDESAPKIFGIERLTVKRPVYIVEGPIDSLFIPNCIAALSSSLYQCAIKAKEVINNNLSDFILVYDNEPRNAEIVKLYDKCIESNYNVVVWPQSYKYKDINEAVIDGMDPRTIYDIIKSNTFNGIEARLRFNSWKKI
jgi:hypothetical protein